nr:hypothetical protein [Tanacetum cinerariifolium]
MDKRRCYIKQQCMKSQSLRKFKRGQDIKIPQSGGPSNKDVSKENFDESFVKEQVSEDTSSFVESPLNVFFVDKKIEFVKPTNYDKPFRKSVRYAEMYRSQRPRGNKEIGMDKSPIN